MAITTQGVQLLHGTTSANLARIGTSPNYVCIKDFPDMSNPQPDQVETTTLCDTVHTYIDGLGNLPDELSFTMNFDNSHWATLDAFLQSGGTLIKSYWGIRIGDSGAKWYFEATGRLELVGAGVGDVLEMRLVLSHKSVFTKA